MNYLQKINKYSNELLNNNNNEANYKLTKYINKYNDELSGGVGVQITLKDHYNKIIDLTTNNYKVFLIRISILNGNTFKRYSNIFLEFILKNGEFSAILGDTFQETNIVYNTIIKDINDTNNNNLDNITDISLKNKLTDIINKIKNKSYTINYSINSIKSINIINNKSSLLYNNSTNNKIDTNKYYICSYVFNSDSKKKIFNKKIIENYAKEITTINYNNNSNIKTFSFNNLKDVTIENGDNITTDQLKDSIICNVYISEDTINNKFLF